MKNKFLLCTTFFLCSLSVVNVYAQIEVQTSGDVKVSSQMAIGTSTNSDISLNIYRLSRGTNPYYGINSYIKTWSSMPTGPIYGIMGVADASASASNYPISPIVGVCGKALKTSEAITNFSAGVAGVANYYGGIGVYGGIGSGSLNMPSTWKGGAYAGYFDGSVKVSGTLTATSLSVSSDYRLKENIVNLENSVAGAINDLRPVSYTYKVDSTNVVYGEGAKEMKMTHYGLIAQDVQRLFPNLVYEGGDGYLSINYVELVPVLILYVQELSEEVNNLREQLEATEKNK